MMGYCRQLTITGFSPFPDAWLRSEVKVLLLCERDFGGILSAVLKEGLNGRVSSCRIYLWGGHNLVWGVGFVLIVVGFFCFVFILFCSVLF